MPPRGERAPRTLESTNPRPRLWRALREGRALAPDAQPAAPDACAPLPRRRAARRTSRRYRPREMRAFLRSRKGDRMGSLPEAKNSLSTHLPAEAGAGKIEEPERPGECLDLGDVLNTLQGNGKHRVRLSYKPRALSVTAGFSLSVQNSRCRAARQGQQVCLSPPPLGCDTHWVLKGQAEVHFSAGLSAPGWVRTCQGREAKGKMSWSRSHSNTLLPVLPGSSMKLPLRDT